MSAWLNLEPADFVAFVFASLLGLLAGAFAPDTSWAVYIPVLVSYHLFLLWLVLSGEHKAGISLTPISTLVTHVACLILILPIGMTRNLPYFSIFRFGIAGFAVFERGWLFSSSHVQPKAQLERPSPVVLNATGEDFEAWTQHLATRKATNRTAGMSVKAEFEQFLHARQRNRPA